MKKMQLYIFEIFSKTIPNLKSLCSLNSVSHNLLFCKICEAVMHLCCSDYVSQNYWKQINLKKFLVNFVFGSISKRK